MKILVAVTNYVVPGKKSSHFFVEARNLYYKKQGVDVQVLNFKAKEDYVVDDIPVYCLKSYAQKCKELKFDLLVVHQSNLRNHYIFLKKYEKYFPRIVFFFHGHEVLNCAKVYSKPYPYVKSHAFYMEWGRRLYDNLKLKLWHDYIPKLLYKSHLVFVSHWMYEEFLKWTRIPEDILRGKTSITYNCIGEHFERLVYRCIGYKKYDFITIRGKLDVSKYAVDIVNELAKQNPQYRFLLVGKGSFFKYNQKATNLEWMDTYLTHDDIVQLLNLSRCALMPTRTDAQGVMMCEMATFGIPVITSDIPVCHEVFESFDNVRFVNNDDVKANDLGAMFDSLQKGIPYKKNEKYFAKNTSGEEVRLFEKVINEK